jgi:hypothetical protein
MNDIGDNVDPQSARRGPRLSPFWPWLLAAVIALIIWDPFGGVAQRIQSQRCAAYLRRMRADVARHPELTGVVFMQTTVPNIRCKGHVPDREAAEKLRSMLAGDPPPVPMGVSVAIQGTELRLTNQKDDWRVLRIE